MWRKNHCRRTDVKSVRERCVAGRKIGASSISQSSGRRRVTSFEREEKEFKGVLRIKISYSAILLRLWLKVARVCLGSM